MLEAQTIVPNTSHNPPHARILPPPHANSRQSNQTSTKFSHNDYPTNMLQKGPLNGNNVSSTGKIMTKPELGSDQISPSTLFSPQIGIQKPYHLQNSHEKFRSGQH